MAPLFIVLTATVVALGVLDSRVGGGAGWWTARAALDGALLVVDHALIGIVTVAGLLALVFRWWGSRNRLREPDVRVADGAFDDRPIGSGAEDRLGFREFAQEFARTLSRVRPQREGFVAAVVGPWGSGKTSFVNLVKEVLEEGSGPKPQFVEFNPWIFDTEASLAGAFFETIDERLSQVSQSRRLRRNLRHYRAALEAAGDVAHPFGNVARAAVSLVSSRRTLDEARRALENDLAGRDSPLIVVVEDVDRLTPAQAAQVLQLIRSQASLPQVIYLLPMDRETVAAMLATRGVDGVAFLQKIIQLEIPIPRANQGRLRTLLEAEVGKIPSLCRAGYRDTDSWGVLYQDGVAELLRTPRDVRRFSYSLDAMLPSVIEEVNVRDYIGLHALRLFEPQVYEGVHQKLSGLSVGTVVGSIVGPAAGDNRE